MRNILKLAIPLSFFLWGFIRAACAEDQPPQPFVTGEVVTIHSKILGEDRNLVIYDPDKFGANRLPAYPVLYTFDENDVAMVSGMVRYLSAYNENISPMLIVGIDGGQTRIRDLTPTHSLIDNLGKEDTDPNSWLKDSGGGERFAQFIRDEVMPYVESHYKAGPFKMLAGHSVGGLETLYCFEAHPEMFDAYFAISPSLWWEKGALISKTEVKLKELAGKNKFVFLADCPETGPFSDYIQKFDVMMKANKPSSLSYEHVFYPTENHGRIAAKAYYDALRYIYPEWTVAEGDTSAALIKKHYHAMALRLGYDVQPPLSVVSDLGNVFLRDPKKTDDALEMFQLNVSNFPHTASVYQDLGEAYAKIGKLPEAIAAFKTAQDLSPNDEAIAHRLKELQQSATAKESPVTNG